MGSFRFDPEPLFVSIAICFIVASLVAPLKAEDRLDQSPDRTYVAGAGSPPQTLQFGIVPQQSATRTARLWVPILRYLSDRIGQPIQMQTAPDIAEFERRLVREEYDLAYMNPYHYVMFSESPGYLAFAKQKDKQIIGILVARRDHPIADLSELAGETLVFPSSAAFAASIIPRAHLRHLGIEFTPKYVSSHGSVYRNVARGFYPAGGGILRTLNNAEDPVKDRLTVIWTSSGYTPHAFAAHPRVPTTVVASIQSAMLAMADDPEGFALLRRIEFTGLAKPAAGDWEDVRALALGLGDLEIAEPADGQ